MRNISYRWHKWHFKGNKLFHIMSLWLCRCVCVCVCQWVKPVTVGRAYKPSYKRSQGHTGQRTEDTHRQTNELPAARVVNNYETMAQTLWMPLQVCACVCVCVSVCTACGSHMFALCVLWHVLASCLPAWLPVCFQLLLFLLLSLHLLLPCLHCATCCILRVYCIPCSPCPTVLMHKF